MSRDEFFQELFVKPKQMEYGHHPPDRVLQAYLAGRLGDEWHFDGGFLPLLRQADLNGDWGLSEVSLHILTCDLCSRRAAQLRAEELAALERNAGLIERFASPVAKGFSLLIANLPRHLSTALRKLGPASSTCERRTAGKRGSRLGALNLSHALEGLGQPVEFFNREALSSSLPIDSHLM